MLPEIVVVINNYSGVNEYLNSMFDISLLQLGKLGISFVVTATLVNNLGFSILQNFRRRIVMQINDDAYSIILSKAGKLRPEPFKGRGLAQIGEKVYEFQTAFVSSAEKQAEHLTNFCNGMFERHGEISAVKVPSLPKYYTCAEINTDNVSLNAIPVGFSSVEAETVSFDFSEKFTVIAHKSLFDICIIQGIAELLSLYYDDRLSVIDCYDTFESAEMNYTYIHGKEETEKYIHTIFEEALYRHNHYNDCVKADKAVPVYEEKAILFCGMGRLISLLSTDIKSDFMEMLDKVGVKHNLRYIIYDKVCDLSILNNIRSFAERTNQASLWSRNGNGEKIKT